MLKSIIIEELKNKSNDYLDGYMEKLESTKGKSSDEISDIMADYGKEHDELFANTIIQKLKDSGIEARIEDELIETRGCSINYKVDKILKIILED